MTISRGLRIMLVQTQAENAGAQEISRLVAEGLEAHGHAVKQMFFFRRTSSFDADSNAIFLCAERPSSPGGVARMLIEAWRTMRREKPDAVIAFQHYGNIIAAPVARLAGVKVVIANQVSAAETISRPVAIADKILGSLGAYTRIIVNSTETENAYKAYPKAYSSRLVRIDHGFADKSVEISKADARHALGLDPQAQILGCAARLHPLKRLDDAIRVLAVNKDLHLALAGQGEDEPRLRELAKQIDAGSRVHFLGELGLREMGLFLAAIDCFVFPSSAETFGLAPVEAAQAGVPVVANELPVLKEVLQVDGEDCAAFVNTTDIEKFAQTVQSILADTAYAARLKQQGRKLARRFPRDKMIDAYVGITEALSGRAATR